MSASETQTFEVAMTARPGLWARLTAPSPQVTDHEARRQARLLAALLIFLLPITLAGAVISLRLAAATATVLFGVTAGMAAAYGLSRTRQYKLAAAIGVELLAISPFAAYLAAGVYTPAAALTTLSWAAPSIILGSFFFSAWTLVFLTLALLAALAVLPALAPATAGGTIESLAVLYVMTTVLTIIVAVQRRRVETDRLNEVLQINRDLQTLRATLEQRVAERTAEISQAAERMRYRAMQLQTSAEVAQAAASTLDLETLLPRVVELIAIRFGFYHVGIFLLNEAREYAVLQAASSEGGRRMLERGYMLNIGDNSVVGSVAASGRARVALDIGPEAYVFDNADLPLTRAEIALPLKVREQVIGVLDVHSVQEAAFTRDDVILLSTLANQVAIAIENAHSFAQQSALMAENRRLLEQSEQAVANLNALARRLTSEGWERYLARQQGDLLAEYLRPGVQVEAAIMPELDQAAENGDLVTTSETGRIAAAYPIILHGEVIGTVGLEDIDPRHHWSDDDLTILADVAQHAALALDNARLFEEAQRRSQELAAAAEIGQAATATFDIDELLRISLQLIQERFGFYHASVFIVEPGTNVAVLRESTGEAGRQLKARKHQLAVGSKSLVGAATATRQPRIVQDVTNDPTHYKNPLLPETRAEAVIPLLRGDTVIGALDVQSKMVNSFTPEAIAILKTIADQLAIAVHNARLYENQRKTAERLAELDRLKSQFLANMSHELRTPLNSIIGFSRVILKGIDGPLTEQQEQDLAVIYNSGHHLLGLINDILDMSKIDAGKLELVFEDVDLRATIKGVLSTTLGLIKDRPITMHEEVPADLPVIRADNMRVRQVLLNLLSNAAKFTDSGSITVRARVVETVAPRTGRVEPFVEISVADTGPGISAEGMAKLFEAFSQVDASPTRKMGGTGLGLNISRHLVEMHGGRIWVESEVGKGSTFTFIIPVRQPESQPTLPMVPLTAGKQIIMAVDDDAGVITLYNRYLEPYNYAVVGVTNSAEAVARAIDLKPAAILLDVLMPNYDGVQVLAELKRNEAARHIPVIMCSIVADQEHGFSLGAADYLVKPILESDLVESLKRVLRAGGDDGQPPGPHVVLVIDDREEDVQFMRRALESVNGFHVLDARTGREGLEIARRQRPQVIILDLMIPEMDGFQVLAELRRDPATSEIPVVVVSAADLTLAEQERLARQTQALLHKGIFSEEELMREVERAVQNV